ncbi:MAG: hypothetical protein PHQ19_03565, partial [Candidatus Krumholzibacteria bacterium]|nr:hypothetical protein [Candidatus Krumholzibacteria bacterium]
MSKRILFRMGISACLALACSTGVSSQAAAQLYQETFGNGQYCDFGFTTAVWDSTAGMIRLGEFQMKRLSSIPGLGTPIDVKVRGDIAYLLTQTALRLYDITDPSAPVQVGIVSVTSQAGDVELAGAYAYVSSNGGGFIVVDIGDPSAPFVAASLSVGDANEACLAGDYAYVSAWSSGVHVIDISDPLAPAEVGSYPGISQAFQIDVSGDLLFVSGYGSGVHILDISNPAAPVLIGSYSAGTIRDIEVDGDRLYIAQHGVGTHILDISVPSAPAFLGTFSSDYPNGLDVNGTLLFISDWSSGIYVLDVTDPASPAQLLHYNQITRDICASGTTVFTASETSLDIFDAANPLLPVPEAGSVNTPGSAYGVAIDGAYAYIADRTAGLQIVDVGDPDNPGSAWSISLSGDSWDVDVDGDYAYVASYESGLQVVDISDPHTPLFVDSLDTDGNAIDVYIDGNYAYVADYFSGLVVVDIGDPSDPVLAGRYYNAANEAAWSVTVDGDFAYVTFTNSTEDVIGLRIIDISDPANPTLHGSYDTPGHAHGLALQGRYAFVADSEEGLLVLDISDPAAPSYVTTLATINAKDVAISGDFAFVADYSGGVRVIDIGDPAAPVILDTYGAANEARRLAFSGEHVYVADGADGVRILQVFQRSFDTTNNLAQSTTVDLTAEMIDQVRMAASTTGSVGWQISADGGLNWESVAADNAWHVLTYPGSDLRWRATLDYRGGAV